MMKTATLCKNMCRYFEKTSECMNQTNKITTINLSSEPIQDIRAKD